LPLARSSPQDLRVTVEESSQDSGIGPRLALRHRNRPAQDLFGITPFVAMGMDRSLETEEPDPVHWDRVRSGAADRHRALDHPRTIVKSMVSKVECAQGIKNASSFHAAISPCSLQRIEHGKVFPLRFAGLPGNREQSSRRAV